MKRTLQILGISGSLRKGSFNTGIIRAAEMLVPDGMTLEPIDLAGIPLYNADLDGPTPPAAVRDLKARVAAADGLLIATPEYNYSVPGVLKNAIDWASRPPKDNPLSGKPAAIVGAGGIMGTVRAQLHLRQILLFNGVLVMAKPEVYVARAWEKFDANGNLTDEATRNSIRALLESLSIWIRTVEAVPQD